MNKTIVSSKTDEAELSFGLTATGFWGLGISPTRPWHKDFFVWLSAGQSGNICRLSTSLFSCLHHAVHKQHNSWTVLSVPRVISNGRLPFPEKNSWRFPIFLYASLSHAMSAVMRESRKMGSTGSKHSYRLVLVNNEQLHAMLQTHSYTIAEPGLSSLSAAAQNGTWPSSTNQNHARWGNLYLPVSKTCLQERCVELCTRCGPVDYQYIVKWHFSQVGLQVYHCLEPWRGSQFEGNCTIIYVSFMFQYKLFTGAYSKSAACGLGSCKTRF